MRRGYETIHRLRLSCGCVVDDQGTIRVTCGEKKHKAGSTHPSGKSAKKR